MCLCVCVCVCIYKYIYIDLVQNMLKMKGHASYVSSQLSTDTSNPKFIKSPSKAMVNHVSVVVDRLARGAMLDFIFHLASYRKMDRSGVLRISILGGI